MRILFSVNDDGSDGTPRDFWLDADPTAPFEVLAGEIDRLTGQSFHQAWWDRDHLLETGRPIGTQVRDGSVLGHRAEDVSPFGSAVAAGELVAVGGPHAGAVWELPPGRHLVGRSDDAAINLWRDPLVSRHHAVLSVTPAEVSVTDERSANGLTIDGRDCTGGPLHDGALLQVGGTVLAWRSGEPPASIVSPDGEGGSVFNRPPRMLTPEGPTTVRFPGPPPSHSGLNFPLMATLAPIVLGVVMWLALNSLLFLLFTVMSPVIGVSTYLTQRRSGAKSHRDRVRAHQDAEERAQQQLAEALQDETNKRRQAFPDPATLRSIAEGPLPTLWERRLTDTDFLALRVGLADLPSAVAIEGVGQAGGEDRQMLRLVPAVVDLERDGVLGLAGARRAVEGLANALLLQAAVLHAPDDLTITILTGPHQADGWSWARWLPHTRDKDGRCVARIGTSDSTVARLAGELSSVIDERLNSNRARLGDGRDKPTAHLVLVDGAYQLGALPAVTKILRRGPEVGVMSICLDDAERLLPEECYAVALFDSERPSWLSLRTGRATNRVEVLGDLVDASTAEAISRRLAPLRLNRRAVAGATIPGSVRLLTQIGLEPPSESAVAAGWQRCDRSTAAVIGESESGPMIIDLAQDGPHGLVAGTTGSGKSELLQTLIASLALVNRPEMMNFVLVDYKGGSAFKECARLPHTVGMVTDLDGHLTERALASLGAELRRREVLLTTVGAKDIEGYWRAASAGSEVLGRLVIVIDEFASLVEELPNFVDGLVDLARRGRSLGIHLILATQRPSGVVSAAIKTNTNLRIAMRVTDSADSVDVIDSPLAARIPKGLPGRGYARVGHEDLTEFQAARIGGRRQLGGTSPIHLQEVRWESLGEIVAERSGPDSTDETTDLATLVEAMRQAAATIGSARPRSPWLPALSQRFTLSGPALSGPGDGDGPGLDAWFGMEDLPEAQSQRSAIYDVSADGHLLVIGDPGSGRSTLLRTLAASLAARSSVEDVHIYGIDCGNGALSDLEAFPHVGAVVSRHEPDRVDRLVSKLLSETTERQQRLARGGFATIADQRRASDPAERLPYVVVLLDRWEGYNAEFETSDGGRLVNSLLHLMREGLGCGIRFVVTADRSGTSPRFASLAERIVMMRLNDRSVYSVLGLNPRHLPDEVPPGRGFYTRGGTEIQVGLLDDEPSGPAQVAAIERLGHAAQRRWSAVPERRRPDPIALLPFHVALDPLLATWVSPGGGPVALVGVGGDRLAPLTVDLSRHGPGFVVSGPPRSGRSNALFVMAQSIRAGGGRILAVTCRPSPLTGLAGQTGVLAVLDGTATSAGDLSALLAEIGAQNLAVIVDDAEMLADSPISDPLAAFVKGARDRASALIIAGTVGELGQFRGFIPEVRKSKAGLLMCPSGAGDGEVVGVRLPRTAVFAGPPGRGVLVLGSDLTVVQVPSIE